MDEVKEISVDSKIDYSAPTIVDYGTLVEATAANHTNNLNDVPMGVPQVGGFSH